MLPRDQGGVVDHNLKVYGTENIYVADASVIPLVRLVALKRPRPFQFMYMLHSLWGHIAWLPSTA